jgi:hypothetical protein
MRRFRIYIVHLVNISRVIKSRKIGRCGYINTAVEKTNIIRISIGELKGNGLSGDLKDTRT